MIRKQIFTAMVAATAPLALILPATGMAATAQAATNAEAAAHSVVLPPAHAKLTPGTRAQFNVCANENNNLCWVCHGAGAQCTVTTSTFIGTFTFTYQGQVDGTGGYTIADASGDCLVALPDNSIVASNGCGSATIFAWFTDGDSSFEDTNTGNIGNWIAIYGLVSGYKLWALGKSGHYWGWQVYTA